MKKKTLSRWARIFLLVRSAIICGHKTDSAAADKHLEKLKKRLRSCCVNVITAFKQIYVSYRVLCNKICIITSPRERESWETEPLAQVKTHPCSLSLAALNSLEMRNAKMLCSKATCKRLFAFC